MASPLIRSAAQGLLAVIALQTLGAQVPTRPAPPRATSVARIPQMASVDTALLRGLKYRLVGPSRGGRVTTVTGVPSQPRTFYMGVASGGVFRTTDGGRELGADHRRQGAGRLDRVRSRWRSRIPNIIYVGTGSDGVRSNVSTGRGVYKTADGGKTW